jgi:hypothetical protein
MGVCSSSAYVPSLKCLSGTSQTLEMLGENLCPINTKEDH